MYKKYTSARFSPGTSAFEVILDQSLALPDL
jgi:hypothetical protein